MSEVSGEPQTGTKKRLESVLDMACGSGSLLLNVRKKVNRAGGTIGKIFGQEKNINTYNLARMNLKSAVTQNIQGVIIPEIGSLKWI